MCEPDFIEDALATHNYWRRRHGVPSLRLNTYLCKLAQGWAVHLATSGRPMTSENTLYQRPLGENIAMKWNNNGTDVTGREITDKWYSGLARYDFHSHTGEDTGQFTQVVWKDSEDFGIGKAQVEDGSWVVVANYYPSGNIVGQYEYNVRYTVDGRIILPSQKDPHSRPRPSTSTIVIKQVPPSPTRGRTSLPATTTIYPYNPDRRESYSPSRSPIRVPTPVQRPRKVSSSSYRQVSPDRWEVYSPPPFTIRNPSSLTRPRKSSASLYRPPSPADNPVTKMVKTQKILDYQNGLPFTKTITTETSIAPDGSKSVVTTETVDPM